MKGTVIRGGEGVSETRAEGNTTNQDAWGGCSLRVGDGLKRALVAATESCMPKEYYNIQVSKLVYGEPALEPGCNHTHWRSVYCDVAASV